MPSDPTARPFGARVVIVIVVVAFVSIGASLAWLRRLPLIDHAEAVDVAARARRLDARSEGGALASYELVQLEVDRACFDAVEGISFSDGLDAIPREERLVRCEPLARRVHELASREGTWRVETAAYHLAMGMNLLNERDRASGRADLAAERAMDVLAVLSHARDVREAFHLGEGEHVALQDLARSVVELDAVQRAEIARRLEPIRARRVNPLASLHRLMIEPSATLAPSPGLDDATARLWVQTLERVTLAERIEALRCPEVSAYRCLDGIVTSPPSCLPHERLGLVLGPRFDRCVVAGAINDRQGYVNEAYELVRGDVAVSLLDEVLAHDPRGEACHGGPMPVWEHEEERLRPVLRGGAIHVPPPDWLVHVIGDPDPVDAVTLPCAP
jgi:hypothetical protein